MASPFRDDVVATLAEVFADLGFDATYTPAGGGTPVPDIKVIPDVQEVESLGIEFAQRIRQTQRLVAILKADVTDRPTAGAAIAIPGFGDFTVIEEAMSRDKFQLVWLCAVREA